ncbi:MAG: hypothetical protein AAF747_00350 [Planctomycetota bacterium]
MREDLTPSYWDDAGLAGIWVEFTVAMANDAKGERMSFEERRAKAEEIIGRWRGNRPAGAVKAKGDELRALFEATIRWVVEETDIVLDDAAGGPKA